MGFDPKKYGAVEVEEKKSFDPAKYGASEIPEKKNPSGNVGGSPGNTGGAAPKSNSLFGALAGFAIDGAKFVNAHPEEARALTEMGNWERAMQDKQEADYQHKTFVQGGNKEGVPEYLTNAAEAAERPDIKARNAAAHNVISQQKDLSDASFAVQSKKMAPAIQTLVGAVAKRPGYWKDGVVDYEKVYNTAGELAKQFGGGDNAKEVIAPMLIGAIQHEARVPRLEKEFDKTLKAKYGYGIDELAKKELTAEQKALVEADYQAIYKQVLGDEEKAQTMANATISKIPAFNGARMGGAFLSGLNNSLASKGSGLTVLGVNNSFTDWLRGRKNAAEYYNIPDNKLTFQNILKDPTGTLGTRVAKQMGTMIPLIAATAITRNPRLSGLIGFGDETTGLVGDAYEQTLAETGNPEQAREAAGKMLVSQVGMAPTYFLEANAILNTLKGKAGVVKNVAMENVINAGQELEQDYKQQSLSKDGKPLDQFLKEDAGGVLAESVIASTGMMGVMSGVGKVYQQVAKASPEVMQQHLAAIMQRDGWLGASKHLNALYENGDIGATEFNKLLVDGKKISEGLKTMQEMGVTGKQALAAVSLTLDIDGLQAKHDKATSAPLKKVLKKQINEKQALLQGVMEGRGGFATVTVDGGSTFVVPREQAANVMQGLKEEVKSGIVTVEVVPEKKDEEAKPLKPEVQEKQKAAIDDWRKSNPEFADMTDEEISFVMEGQKATDAGASNGSEPVTTGDGLSTAPAPATVASPTTDDGLRQAQADKQEAESETVDSGQLTEEPAAAETAQQVADTTEKQNAEIEEQDSPEPEIVAEAETTDSTAEPAVEDVSRETNNVPQEDMNVSPETEGAQAEDSSQTNQRPEQNATEPAPAPQENAAPKMVRFRFGDGKIRTGKVESVEDGFYQIRDSNGFKYKVDESAIYEKDGVKVKDDEMAEQDRTAAPLPDEFAKSDSTEKRIPVDPIEGVQPEQLSNMIFKLGKNTGSRIFYAKPSRRKSAGTYSAATAAVKVKFANDLDTTAHEIGHAMDDRFGILSDLKTNPSPEVEAELTELADNGGSKPPKGYHDPKAYQMAEGAAEFIRSLIVNPKETQRRYPNTTQLYNEKVDEDFKKALNDFGFEVRAFYGASGRDMTLANIEWKSEQKKGWLSELLKRSKENGNDFYISFADRMKANFLNPLHVFESAAKYLRGEKGIKDVLPADSPEILARALLHVGAKVDSIINDGMVDAELNRLQDENGQVKNIDWLLEPLDSTTSETLENELKDTAAYMIAERTIELSKRFERNSVITGAGGGLVSDIAVANKMLAEYENYPADKKERIAEGAKRYRELADDVLRYMVQKGRMAEAVYDKEGNLIGGYQFIKQNNLYYVGMQRVLETEPNQAVTPFAKPGGKALASKSEVVHSIKGSTQKIANPYASLLDTVNKAIKESDRNEVMLTMRNLLTGDRKMYDGEVQRLSDIGSIAKPEDRNTIPIFVDGKAEQWRFQEDLYKDLKGLSENTILPKALTALPRLLRWSVTHSPIFALRNITRDTQDRVVKSNENNSKNWFGLKDLAGNKEDWKTVGLAGGLNSGHYVKDRQHYDALLTEAIDRLSKDGKTIVLHPGKLAAKAWKGYEALLEKGETMNRVAEFRAAFRKAKEQGMDDYNANLYAGNRAADLVDFALVGHKMKTINQLVPFTNAAVQGLRSTIVRAKAAPGAFALRMTLATVIPQAILWMMAHEDEDDAEEYEQMPDYQRDMFWNFKVGENTWASIPKAYEMGLLSAGIDRGLSLAYGNKKAFDGAAGSAAKSLIPLDEAAIAGPFKALVEDLANYDFFRQHHIVPSYEEGLDLALRKTDRASRIGQALSKVFGWDPRMIDHTIKTTTSYPGNYALKLSNIGREGGEHFSTSDLGFFKDSPLYNAKSVQEMMDVAERYGLTRTKEITEFKNLLNAAMDANGEAKKVARKKLMNFIDEKLPGMIERGKEKVKKAESESD
jgi:hypothetical protein